MKPKLFAVATVLLLLAGVIPTAHAVECAAGVVRAGCADPNGAVVVGARSRPNLGVPTLSDLSPVWVVSYRPQAGEG
jgi:hypothetical protein